MSGTAAIWLMSNKSIQSQQARSAFVYNIIILKSSKRFLQLLKYEGRICYMTIYGLNDWLLSTTSCHLIPPDPIFNIFPALIQLNSTLPLTFVYKMDGINALLPSLNFEDCLHWHIALVQPKHTKNGLSSTYLTPANQTIFSKNWRFLQQIE